MSFLPLPLLYKILAESVAYLLHRNPQEVVASLLRRISPDHNPTGAATYVLESTADAVVGKMSLSALFGNATMPYALLLIAGGSIVGCLSVVHTLAADRYPSRVRSTGVNMAAAIGRCGAVAGPLLGGFSVRPEFAL